MLRPVTLHVAAFVGEGVGFQKTEKQVLDDTHRIELRNNMNSQATVVVTDHLTFSGDVYGPFSSHTIHTTLTIPLAADEVSQFERITDSYYELAGWWMRSAANRVFRWMDREELFELGPQPLAPKVEVEPNNDTAEGACISINNQIKVGQHVHGPFSSRALGITLTSPVTADKLASFDKIADKVFDRTQLYLMKRMNSVFTEGGKEPIFQISTT